jgi:uncharacterized membrane-anchored protein
VKGLLGDGRRWLLAALLLPILAIGAMIIRSEAHLQGREWRFPIGGYYPRDLLRGHYLTFRIAWDRDSSSQNSCWDCCICLKETGSEQTARRTPCAYATDCDVKLSPQEEQALSRFYVPEDEAQKLDQVVRLGRGSVVLVEKRGQLTLKELLVDGQPWQDFAQTEDQR